MSTSVIEKKFRRTEVSIEQRKMLDKIEKENRKFDPRETAKYQALDAEADRLSFEIINDEADQERRRAAAERELTARGGNMNPEKEFRDVGEFFYTVARNRKDGIADVRLDLLREKREQTMGTGASGGFAVPAQFDAAIRSVQAAEAVVRPRATVIPAGDPPDAKFTFPSLDQTSGKNIYGGVTLVHTGEGVTMTETDAKLREVSFEPKEISAYIVVTNKLLNNWTASGAFLTSTLASAMAGQEDSDFLLGNGVNRALGVINSAAAVVQSRTGAGAIAFADCYNMLARTLMRGSGSYIWLASQTTIPQLAAMTDAGTHAVWLASRADAGAGAAGPLPSTLLGMPVIFSDRLPALGTKGDLSLVNLKYYVVKDGSGPFIASSDHILFLSNKTIFKVVWNVDGHPWLTEPLALEGSPTNKVSPFVILE